MHKDLFTLAESDIIMIKEKYKCKEKILTIILVMDHDNKNIH